MHWIENPLMSEKEYELLLVTMHAHINHYDLYLPDLYFIYIELLGSHRLSGVSNTTAARGGCFNCRPFKTE